MNLNRFTEKVQEALRAAQSAAASYNHQQVDVEHLLLSLLDQEGGLAASVLTKAGAQISTIKSRLENDLARMPKVSGPGVAADQIYVTQKLSKLLAKAEDEAKRLKDDYVSVEHILLAAAETSPIFKDLHIERDRVM